MHMCRRNWGRRVAATVFVAVAVSQEDVTGGPALGAAEWQAAKRLLLATVLQMVGRQAEV